jgi:hypothetical protein
MKEMVMKFKSTRKTSYRIRVTDVSDELTALILRVPAVQDEEYVEREGRGRKLLSNVSNNLPVN